MIAFVDAAGKNMLHSDLLYDRSFTNPVGQVPIQQLT